MRNKIIYTVLAIGSLAFSGCNDYLDKLPDNRTNLNTKENISELLVNAYPKNTYVSFTEVMSDNAGDKGSSVTPYTYNSEPYFWKDFTSNGIDSPDSYWVACYNAIAHANMALEAIAKLGDTKDLSAQKGEALICRAYSHFMLVSLFGKSYDPQTADTDLGVPYVKEVETVVDKRYTRATVAEVYRLVEEDLIAALPLLSDDAYTITKYHFNVAAANAFAARFYLFKKDYAKVVTYSDKVLGSNLISKLRDWRKYAVMTYYQMRQNYTLTSESSILLQQEAFSIWGRSLQTYRYSLSADKMTELFSRNVVNGSWLYAVYGSEYTYGIPKFEEYFKKVSVDATTGWPFNMIPLFTCEELFFNRLEALVELGTPTDQILPALNSYLTLRISGFDPVANPLTLTTITNYYNLPTEKENVMACLLGLKRVDFIHEGMRWFDILRHKIEVVHKINGGGVVTLPADDPRRIIQIPLNAINSGIPANPR